jgi:hypothetical protein
MQVEMKNGLACTDAVVEDGAISRKEIAFACQLRGN